MQRSCFRTLHGDIILYFKYDNALVLCQCEGKQY